MTILSKPAESAEVEAAIAGMIQQMNELREQMGRDQREIDLLKEETAHIKTRNSELRKQTLNLLDTLLPIPDLSSL